ncbi:hypothetical protein Bca4012_062010 [Brassica carinata]
MDVQNENGLWQQQLEPSTSNRSLQERVVEALAARHLSENRRDTPLFAVRNVPPLTVSPPQGRVDLVLRSCLRFTRRRYDSSIVDRKRGKTGSAATVSPKSRLPPSPFFLGSRRLSIRSQSYLL